MSLLRTSQSSYSTRAQATNHHIIDDIQLVNIPPVKIATPPRAQAFHPHDIGFFDLNPNADAIELKDDDNQIHHNFFSFTNHLKELMRACISFIIMMHDVISLKIGLIHMHMGLLRPYFYYVVPAGIAGRVRVLPTR